MKLYFVSELGDIQVTKINEKVVEITTSNITLGEEKLIKKLINKFSNKLTDKCFDKDENLDNTTIRFENISINKVHKEMEKILKKGKPVLTAIKFIDGKIELCKELIKGDIESAVTVDKPHRGCPMPIMLKSEIRASRVIKEFLNDTQLKDYEKYSSIVSIGNYSNRPYKITSRWNPDINKYGQVYDIVNKRVICANCMEIPPSEEMLSLMLSIQFNEREFINI